MKNSIRVLLVFELVVIMPAVATARVEIPQPTVPQYIDSECADETCLVRHQRKVEKVLRIMAAEGGHYSEEKYKKYQARFGSGIFFLVIGGVSLISSVMVAMSTIDFSWHDDDQDNLEDEYAREHNIALGLLIGSATSIAIGVPLLVTGIIGRNRQRYLKKYKYLLGISYDQASGAGLLSFQVTF